MKKVILGLIVLLTLALVAALIWLPKMTDKRLNPVIQHASFTISEQA